MVRGPGSAHPRLCRWDLLFWLKLGGLLATLRASIEAERFRRSDCHFDWSAKPPASAIHEEEKRRCRRGVAGLTIAGLFVSKFSDDRGSHAERWGDLCYLMGVTNPITLEGFPPWLRS